MALYPVSPVPSFPYPVKSRFKTLISEADSGVEVRRSLWRFAKRLIPPLRYGELTQAERNTLRTFFYTYFGAYSTFYYKDWFLQYWYDQKIGYGDGVTATFDIPSFTTTNDSTLKAFVAGVEKTKTTHWNPVSGGGTEGSDRITFTAGNIPTTGQLITMNFTGYIRLRVRFDDDMDEEIFSPSYGSLTINLTEAPA